MIPHVKSCLTKETCLRDWCRLHPASAFWLISTLLTLLVLSNASLARPDAFTDVDSSVFEYIGIVIQHGGVPYVDTFDHKGPLLYLINWMGLELAGCRGILIFEAISVCVFFFATLCRNPLGERRKAATC